MQSVIEAKAKIRDLGVKAKSIQADPRMTNATKLKKLSELEAELKESRQVLETHRQAGLLMAGAESMQSPYGNAIATGRAAKGLATPSLSLSFEQQQDFYQAAKSGQNLRVELKDVANSEAARGDLPAQFIGLVDRKFEPTRILAAIPSTPMAGPSVEFISHTSNTPGIGAPVITLGTAATGGNFAAGTYYWKLTATNSGGETIGSNELTATLSANQKQPINWTAVTGANGYRLYRGTAAGAENVLVAVITGGATVTYTDLGDAGTGATVPTIDRTAGARTVAAGGQMPETSLVPTSTILTAKKLAIFSTVTDELMADFPTFSQYTEVELQRQITDAENWQLLNGDGTGDNLLGLLNTTGTLSRAKGATDTALDVLEQGITDLRNGPSYCEPDAIIINPNTWSAIRRTKNSLGDYVLGDPGQTTVSDVWGVPVLQTTQITPGVIVMGNLEIATQAFVREGVILSLSNSSDNDFTNGKVKIRATERLTLGVSRPTALNILTGF